jgi:hypothetical protein
MTLWCRLCVLDGEGRVSGREALEGAGAPDLGAVEEIARRALAAARRGGRLVLVDVAPEMRELLDLVELPVEVEGEPERREQALRIEEGQEERHLGDLAL